MNDNLYLLIPSGWMMPLAPKANYAPDPPPRARVLRSTIGRKTFSAVSPDSLGPMTRLSLGPAMGLAPDARAEGRAPPLRRVDVHQIVFGACLRDDTPARICIILKR
jgi:hypothetical protein